MDPPGYVWYAAYGSNLHPQRFAHYLSGGTPPGGLRPTPGCRDPRPPRAERVVEVPGGIFFATPSLVWGGGRAFYDPALPGSAAMRAYRITTAQFADLAAQEMYDRPGTDLDLTGVLTTGRATLGDGRYETLLRLHPPGLNDVPTLTFTCPWGAGEVPGLAPSAAYLRNLALGLSEGHGWAPHRVAEYLTAAPGAAGQWSAAEVMSLLVKGQGNPGVRATRARGRS